MPIRHGSSQFTTPKGKQALTGTDAQTVLHDLTDELLVVSTLLSIMAAQDANMPLLLQMSATSVERCQELAAELARIDQRKG